MKDELFRNNTEFTQPARSSLEPNARPSDVGGVPPSGGDPRAVANWRDLPDFGSVENAGPPTNLPESVPASSAVAESLRRSQNILSPADRGDL
jgi:hypothetical protein